MKYFIICLLTCFVFSHSLLAQNQVNPEDGLFQASSLLMQELTAGENAVLVVQEGNDNQAQIQQIHQDGADASFVISNQSGNENIVNIRDEGSGNQMVVLQNGNQNIYNAEHSGTGLQSYVLQEGDRNTVTQSYTGSVNTTAEIVQIGNDNEVIHEVQDGVDQSFTLIQEGERQSVIIRQSNN